jgi:misacylated tRNA(Ala) deacylase
MAEALYLDNMSMTEFDADVVSVIEEKYVVLDRTAFYPKSGGVSFDTGRIIRKSDGKVFDIVFVGKFNDEISHEVSKGGLKPGDRVGGRVDWERRFNLMRYHTAAHILSGVFWNEGGVKISGNALNVDGGRMDFTLENFNRNIIENYVEKANEIVKEDLSVEVYYISRKKFDDDPDLVKLAVGFPKNIEEVRIVDIKGFDKQPDGGCHVSSTNQVGNIMLTKMKNKGKNNRRIYFSLE